MSEHRLSRHATPEGARWAYDGRFLPYRVDLALLLAMPAEKMRAVLAAFPKGEPTDAPVLAPLDSAHEVWASGVTYLRSRDARKAESARAGGGDIYERVYLAQRPELFLKSIGWRVVPDGGEVRIRRDASWNVPEPEVVLVINGVGEIVGYCAGNDMSSRDIEGENPLYLPQAKVYDGSCALGPAIVLAGPKDLHDIGVALAIERGGRTIFEGTSRTTQMKRSFEELARYLCAELALPHGVLLMTGTGIVPPDDFTLVVDDRIRIDVGPLRLANVVAS
jgi:2-dehydro-3-deoxy-D-arabinonate dehydratase